MQSYNIVTSRENVIDHPFNNVALNIFNAILFICSFVNENHEVKFTRVSSIEKELQKYGLSAKVSLRVHFNEPRVIVSLNGVQYSFRVNCKECRSIIDATFTAVRRNIDIPWLETTELEIYRHQNYCSVCQNIH